MALWVWIAVGVGVLLFIWLLVVVIGTPARRREAKREKAAELRQDADEKLASAARREAAADQEAAVARRERLAAEHAMEEADTVDPDLPDKPTTAATRASPMTESADA